MFDSLYNYLKKPPIYTKSSTKFWDDEYISSQMLSAHLDPEFDGASRKPDFIDKSVEWICNVAPPDKYKKLLDLGCGPGLYTQRLAQKDYMVTGIDFSQRSINYAVDTANKLNLQIDYIYKNYLTIDYKDEFDVIIMIYCDYGALSDEDRFVLLQKVYKALKPGGKFIFDVFTPNKYKNHSDGTSWQLYEKGGFWSNESHICLNGSFKYENDTVLDQTVVIKKDNIFSYYIWDHYFTEKSIINETFKFGFKDYQIFNDVSGKIYFEDNETLCLVLEK
ncbi:MAG: SAM-dependent methyltransferase [Clostridia bacterium]|nr:SAM-dependent methyltransferase [Clostridia bacterium]